MDGTYNIYGTVMVDPDITYNHVCPDYVSGENMVDIHVYDQNNGVPLTYKVDDEPSAWEWGGPIETWVENYLQQYKV